MQSTLDRLRTGESRVVNLNEQQQAAVVAGDGPTLVLAGAGTGKTRVIIERLAWLVRERGVDPRSLLALTFTNRAAGEMRERLAERLGVERPEAWLGTFHSFGLYVLRREMKHLGRGATFTVFDDADQLSLMKRLVKGLPDAAERVSPREALRWISGLKQGVQTPENVAVDEDNAEEASYRLLWERYHAALEQSSAVDFDDLLVLVVRLFQEHEEVLHKYQRRFRYVLVDEYQDTNRAQYLITQALCGEHGNLYVVGDEDQSIYSWRGADVNNILDFTDDFPGAAVFRLEDNYRSTKPILDGANRVVSNNVNRLGKTLRTSKAGDRIRYFRGEDGAAEGKFIVEDLLKRKFPLGDVAVLFRTHAQSRMIEEALLKAGVAYRMVGGVKFYGRKEVKDILCYLRLLVNPRDDESVRRVLNVPARGIGSVSARQFEATASARGVSLIDVLREVEMEETVGLRARRSAGKFVELVDDLTIEAKEQSVESVVSLLLDRLKYRAYLEEQDEKDFRTRLEIVDEFVSACATYDLDDGEGLLSFLQTLSLVSAVDDWEAGSAAVTLMTCHSAKGLEFDYVYLVGLEEGLLPFARDVNPDDDIEEERRLCYVAMTRARKGLTLTCAASRMLYGREESREVSRFVAEVGAEQLDHVSEKAGPVAKSAPMQTVDPSILKMGTRVRHGKFGPGRVMYTSGSGDKLKARVRFETGRTALLMVKHAPLKILGGKK